MELKSIIVQVVREELPGIVRDMVRGELGLVPAARAKTPVKNPISRRPRRPQAAVDAGVSVGQKWVGRPYSGSKGRVIEIESLGVSHVKPKILKSPGKRSAAKHISYSVLRSSYKPA